MSEFITCLKEWQTLVAGLLALAAAIIAWRQLNFQRQESESRRRRREMAYRAVLPVDLATFMDYLEDCYEAAVIALQMMRPEGAGSETFNIPKLPDRLIPNLQNLIEQLDKHNADAIAEILKSYQLQNSRLRAALENFNSENSDAAIEATFQDTVRLWLLVDGVFPFSRDEEKTIPPFSLSEAEVKRALVFLGQKSSYYIPSANDEKRIYAALAKEID